VPGPEMNLLLVAVKKDDTCDQSGWMNGRCNNVVAFFVLILQCGSVFCSHVKAARHGKPLRAAQREVSRHDFS